MSKTIKVAGALLLFAVAGYMAMKSVGDGPDAALAKEFSFVCVSTGEIFELDMDDVVAIPARNPRNGEETLLPCKREPSGTYRVLDRYRAPLADDLKELNRFVDPVTLEVKPKG